MAVTDKFLHLFLQTQLFDQRAAGHGDHQPQHHIDNGHLPAENAHQQHQTAQIHHGGGDQKRESNAQRQSRAGETDEQRNGRTGTERRDSAQKSRGTVCENAVKPAQDLFGPLRRKIALDIGNDQYQHAQQDHDLDHIIEKELDASAHLAFGVQPAGFHGAADQAAQPFHTQDFILKEIPSGLPRLHPYFLASRLNQEKLI